MIRVKNLYKKYNKPWNDNINVLNGINTNIKKGEKVVIIGPSGSGKSTFLRCLNGLEKVSSGEIYFNDYLITSPKCDLRFIRQHIGMVFQEFNLFPHLTVKQNITLAPTSLKLMNTKEASDIANFLLERVGLLDKANVFPNSLSGGQKQRVAIVRALALEPDVVLFDEPTSALDPEMVKEVADVILELATVGMTMIIVTHEIEFAKNFSSRLLFMENGKIILDDTSKNVFENCKNERVKNFISKTSK